MTVKRSAKKVKKATVRRAPEGIAKKTVKRAKRVVKRGPTKDFGPKVGMATYVAERGLVVPKGYGADPNTGLITPKASQAPIKASKLKKGLQEARNIIDSSIANIFARSDDYDIKAIELSLTFGVKGEFLGFGGSGATTVKVTIGPPSR